MIIHFPENVNFYLIFSCFKHMYSKIELYLNDSSFDEDYDSERTLQFCIEHAKQDIAELIIFVSNTDTNLDKAGDILQIHIEKGFVVSISCNTIDEATIANNIFNEIQANIQQ